MAYDVSKLECVRSNSDGTIQAACPECRKNGSDKTGNHLKVWPQGTFNCILDQSSSHVAGIRRFLKGIVSDGDIEYIEPQAKLTQETIYPETSLNKLVKDQSYWVGRGMNEATLNRLECGVAPLDEKGKLAGRSIFPLRNLEGKIAGFSGRLIGNNSFAPKWKHLCRISKMVYPWNVTGPTIEQTKTVVLVESIGDLLALMSHDINPVLCIFGLKMHDVIISALVGADVRRVFVSLNRDDNPTKGQAACDRIVRRLTPFIEDVRVRLPGEGFKDWGLCAEGGEAGAAELAKFREEIK